MICTVPMPVHDNVTVRTCSDHRSLAQSFVGLSKAACDRITRWVQKVCVYNMTLEYIPGHRTGHHPGFSVRTVLAGHILTCRLRRYHPYAMYCPVLLSQPWDALLAQPCMMGVSEFSSCGFPPRFGAAGGDRTGDRTAKCAFWS